MHGRTYHDIRVLQSQIEKEINKTNMWMLYNKLPIHYKITVLFNEYSSSIFPSITTPFKKQNT